MKESEFVEEVKRAKLGVFSSKDVAKLIGKNINYTRVYLKRLEERDTIRRITKARYCLAEARPEVVASNLLSPSYVSFLGGLAYHNLTTQIPQTLHVVTYRNLKEVAYEGVKIRFIKIHPRRVFGYQKHKHEMGYAFVGDKEKIIVDAAYLPQYCPLTEIKEALERGVDREKLIGYTKRMNSIVVAKRVGYLMELSGIDASPLKKLINRSYDPLNPLFPESGERAKEWKLIINEVLE
ncbi:MAG: hypothetical protein J7L23_03655 [Candidatus Diapherotrites archaeon]|nr:hypothetical protein [Candidatus Diapherotrites archaeon]